MKASGYRVILLFLWLPVVDIAVNAAFEEAAKEVIKRAIEIGTPIIVWRNGSVVKLDPHEVSATKRKKTAE